MARVVIVGMLEAYDGVQPGDEVWGVNCTYWHQHNLTRLYFFDPLKQWPTMRKPEEFYREVNALDIPVVTRVHDPAIPKSVAFPIEELTREFGVVYYASTLCYMLAHAIYEGFDEILLHKIHVVPSCFKYADQKACLDFWCGVALGRGIKLTMGEDVCLARPYPWDTPLYGYLHGNVVAMEIGMMQRAATLSMLPVTFTPVDGTAEVAEAVRAMPSAHVSRYPVAETEADVTLPRNHTMALIKRFAMGERPPAKDGTVPKGDAQ